MKIDWKSCFKIGISIFILYLCIYFLPNALNLIKIVASAVMPVVLGIVVAYIVNILMGFYERHYFPKSKKQILVKSRRPVCMVAAYLTFFGAVAIIIALMVPQLVECIKVLIAKFPSAYSNVIARLEEWHIFTDDLLAQLKNIDWKSRLDQIISMVGSGLGSAVDIVVGTVSSVISGTVTGVLAFVFSIYVLFSKETLKNQCERLFKWIMGKRRYGKFMHVVAIGNDCFRRYIVGQCIEAVILGVLCAVGMMILGLPYPTMIGALIAFTALVPVAGAYIGGGLGAFMIFTESPIKALIFIVFLVILQQLEGNLIYPRVVGSSMGLPGIWVLAAVTVGGSLMGVLGMLLSVPIAAIIYRLLKEAVSDDEKQEKKKIFKKTA